MTTMRTLRGRLALLAGAVTAAAVALLLPRGGPGGGQALSPGPLSSKHASFTREQGCAACHQAHEAGGRRVLQAAFGEAPGGLSCAGCHAFGGPEDAAHNRAGARATSCTQCHTEHKGEASIIKVSDGQCHTCHKTKFESFSAGHPEFRPNYPHADRPAVRFDHLAHMGKYFKDPNFSSKAPKACAACHDVRAAGLRVPPVDFARACAACHASQLRNELTLLRLPEKGSEASALPDLSAAELYALSVSSKDAKGYAAKVGQLIPALAGSGSAELLELLRARAGERAGALLAGLNEDAVRGPAKAWVEGKEHALPEKAPLGGWYWYEDMLKELRYKPTGHADPVLRAWLELAAAAPSDPKDPADRRRAQAFRKRLLDPKDGPGTCMRCHSAEAGKVAWTYREARARPLNRYSHVPHVRMLDCADCHRLKKGGSGSLNNFEPIAKGSCMRCHAQAKVREDCRLCHSYHADHAFKETMAKALGN